MFSVIHVRLYNGIILVNSVENACNTCNPEIAKERCNPICTDTTDCLFVEHRHRGAVSGLWAVLSLHMCLSGCAWVPVSPSLRVRAAQEIPCRPPTLTVWSIPIIRTLNCFYNNSPPLMPLIPSILATLIEWSFMTHKRLTALVLISLKSRSLFLQPNAETLLSSSSGVRCILSLYASHPCPSIHVI